jgi:N-methylhydantoinase A
MGTLIGIDVGGTFTDLYSHNQMTGERYVLKVPSTPQDPSKGLLDALEETKISPKEVDSLLHGTTIATNAVIERRGARCALITTKGFRDILELGRRDRPSLFGLSGVQNPLIPRDRRWEVAERVDYHGNILLELDPAEVEGLAATLMQDHIECVVVALIHAYANPTHERAIRDILLKANPRWHVVLATDVLSEQYEFERTSTAVVQGFLQPLVANYAHKLGTKLAEFGLERDALVMQSNGGLIALRQLGSRAANIIRSGPAAGVVAAAEIAAQAGYKNVITGDMGGTSFDVAVIMDGKPDVSESTLLDFRVPLKLPMIDVHTIGAGGGSIAWIDRGGLLQVGPRSAGALPGPACYGLGGHEPTVTDANLVLGRINDNRPIGRESAPLDVEASRRAVATIGDELKLNIEQAAEAILLVVNQNMAGRIRLMSVERGYDPRDFAFVAFGGAGPLHAAALLAEVGIGTMIIPPHPGVLCAMGCVVADLRYDFSQTLETAVHELDIGLVRGVFERHEHEGRARLDSNHVKLSSILVSYSADMAYQGQIHTISVPLEAQVTNETIEKAFINKYKDEFGAELKNSIPILVTLRTTVTGVRPRDQQNVVPVTNFRPAIPRQQRKVHFRQWYDTPVFWRPDFKPGDTFDGPAILEQPDTTAVIEPGMQARVDSFGNILVEML